MAKVEGTADGSGEEVTHPEYDDICSHKDCLESGNWFWKDERGQMVACWGHFRALMEDPGNWTESYMRRSGQN